MTSTQTKDKRRMIAYMVLTGLLLGSTSTVSIPLVMAESDEDAGQYMDPYYGSYDHYSWLVHDHREMAWQASIVESAWKAGIISDGDYFWELMSQLYFERHLVLEFADNDWSGVADKESADYLKDIVQNTPAQKKIEALIASR